MTGGVPGAVVVSLAGFPFSLTTAEPDALTLPLTVSSENVNRFALFVVFAGSVVTRLILAAHFTVPSNPATFGLDVHAQVFALFTAALIVTDPPDAVRLDLLALTVTLFELVAADTAEPTTEITESEPRTTAATMVRGALFMSTASLEAVGCLEGISDREDAKWPGA